MGIREWAIKALGGKVPTKPLVGYSQSYGLPNYSNFDDFKSIERYLTLDDIYAIVHKIAKTAAMIPLRVYEVKDDKAMKAYQNAMQVKSYTTQDIIKKQFLKTKALVEVKEDNQLQVLIDKPNDIYAKTEFYEGAYTFKLMTGNTYLYTPKYEAGLDRGKPYEMWILPSQYTSPVITQQFPHSITKYDFRLFGAKDIPVDEVLHLRYFNPNFTIDGNELIGLSPLQVLHRAAEVAEGETKYMFRGFENSGAQGIVNFEGLEESETTKLGAMKADFYRDSSGSGNARKSLFHAGKTTFTQIGLGPVDMKVIESRKVTFKRFCNVFGVSDRLFNNDATGSEISAKLMMKELFTNAALPEVHSLRDVINQRITPLYNNNGKTYFVDCDITGITELQEDMELMAKIYSSLPIMQPNMILEAFNYGKLDDPLMDKYYIKSGYQPIDDLNMVDLPITQDYGNGTGN